MDIHVYMAHSLQPKRKAQQGEYLKSRHLKKCHKIHLGSVSIVFTWE